MTNPYSIVTGTGGDTTGWSAFNRGYETWLVHDACGSANMEQHEAGLRAFGFAFGDVISTEEAVKRLEAEVVVWRKLHPRLILLCCLGGVCRETRRHEASISSASYLIPCISHQSFSVCSS
jgi:hypothetical protein